MHVYQLEAIWDTPELIQSLAKYAEQRGDDVPEQDVGERTASLLLLRVQAAADYFTDDKALMETPPPVLVDLILDPFVFNVVPRSLIPTAAYLCGLAPVAWFIARSIARRLGSMAAPESTRKKDL